MHRLFVALLPDRQTINRLTKLQAGIKGRKTPPENFHLTLMFLGDQASANIPKLKTFIETLDFRAFDFCIDRRGFFSRLRISWAGTSETPPLLVKLHKDIWNHLVPQYAGEREKTFRPHITLARKAQPTEPIVPDPCIWHVDRLALMESIISGNPGQSATYRILHEKHARQP